MSGVYDKLRNYFSDTLPFTARELDLLYQFFEAKNIKKKTHLLESGHVCNFIAFIASGTIRHFHIKDGIEKTCDISFENSWVTDFHSFTHRIPGVMNLQALEDSTVLSISAEKLTALYRFSPRYESFGRLMAEQVALRATTIAMSLSAEKPEERFLKLLENRPDLFQRVPQKYIANFLGVSPESLSRIQKRILTKSKS